MARARVCRLLFSASLADLNLIQGFHGVGLPVPFLVGSAFARARGAHLFKSPFLSLPNAYFHLVLTITGHTGPPHFGHFFSFRSDRYPHFRHADSSVNLSLKAFKTSDSPFTLTHVSSLDFLGPVHVSPSQLDRFLVHEFREFLVVRDHDALGTPTCSVRNAVISQPGLDRPIETAPAAVLGQVIVDDVNSSFSCHTCALSYPFSNSENSFIVHTCDRAL